MTDPTDPTDPTDRPDGSSTTCGRCGITAAGPTPLTWSTSHGPRGVTAVCGACTRSHLRAMEAKLDEEHW